MLVGSATLDDLEAVPVDLLPWRYIDMHASGLLSNFKS